MGAHKFLSGLDWKLNLELRNLHSEIFLKLELVTFLKGPASVEKWLNTLVYLQRKIFQNNFSFTCTFVFHIVQEYVFLK